jgi:hypothetical protein
MFAVPSHLTASELFLREETGEGRHGFALRDVKRRRHPDAGMSASFTTPTISKTGLIDKNQPLTIGQVSSSVK